MWRVEVHSSTDEMIFIGCFGHKGGVKPSFLGTQAKGKNLKILG